MRAVALCVLAVCLGLAVARPLLEIESETEYPFERYVRDFNKDYSPSEYVEHYKTYSARVAAIAAHNRDRTNTYRRGMCLWLFFLLLCFELFITNVPPFFHICRGCAQV